MNKEQAFQRLSSELHDYIVDRAAEVTKYGSAEVNDVDGLTFTANRGQIGLWARRPGYSWPCSELLRQGDPDVFARFASNGDLLDTNAGCSADELDAWTHAIWDELPA